MRRGRGPLGCDVEEGDEAEARAGKARVRRTLLMIAVLSVGIIIGWQVNNWLAIDSCLDAGGAWEYRGSYCYGVGPAR